MMKFLALFMVLSFISIHAYADLVMDVCRKSSNPVMCIRTLRSDPTSATANVAGLGLIMVKEVKLKVENLLSTVESILEKGPPESELIPIYEKCVGYYDFIINNNLVVADTTLRLRPGDPGFAESSMIDAVALFDACQSWPKDMPPLPITSKHIYAREIAAIAIAIIRVLENN